MREAAFGVSRHGDLGQDIFGAPAIGAFAWHMGGIGLVVNFLIINTTSRSGPGGRHREEVGYEL